MSNDNSLSLAQDEMRTAVNGKDGQPGTGGQALIVQAYALAVAQQPSVDFGDTLAKDSRLIPVQENLNKILTEAKTGSKLYLNELQPAMIDTIVRVDRYCNLQLALTRLIKPGTERAVIVRNLQAIESQVRGFESEASEVARRLAAFRADLSSQSSVYQEQLKTLAKITDGDEGLIASLGEQMSDVDGKIRGLIASTVLSGLAVVGGGLLIAIGSIAGFVTAGTSIPLAVLGGVIAAGGIGGTVASGIALDALTKQKSELLLQKVGLEHELVFALGLRSTLGDLNAGSTAAATAAQGMSSAWNTLGGHLKNLADDLQAGRVEIEDLLALFIASAEEDVKDIKGDVQRIKDSLAGVHVFASRDAPLGEVINTGRVQTAQSLIAA